MAEKQYMDGPSLSPVFCRQRKPQRGFVYHFLERKKTLGGLNLKTGHGQFFFIANSFPFVWLVVSRCRDVMLPADMKQWAALSHLSSQVTTDCEL